MLTGPALTCLFQVTRTIITALPILWRWNVAKSYPRLMWALASVPLLGMVGLVAFAYEEHPLTQRSRLMFIDEETEHQLSAASYPKIVDKHRHQLLANTHPDHRAVASIASELLKVVGPVCDWKLHVIADDRVVNAFVSPTGNIFVYTGLLRAAGSSDEVAAILAHELAHVISRHGAEKLGFQHIAKLCWDFVHSLVYTVTVNLPMLGDVVGRGVDATKEMITALPYSRMCEKEADTIGMYLMAVGGYNPRAAVEFWDKMDTANADNPDRPYEFLSDHPSHERRAQELRQHLPSALGIFRTRAAIAGKIAAARGAAPTTMEDFNRGLFEVLREHLMPALEDNTANDGELARQTATLAKECFWKGSRKLQGAA
ncbi:hypothetical protein HDU87_007557 [Geranomyces variabilis]|uniref:Peptidase M48 domain-containing protein n=1 Tax=Geranomyces variabilis TaxID=109894 RepID=A0AAD5TQ56_9FUNG|nr:hypothetical protein HDU87_007557 [Geranomyces variabilis]